MITTIIREIEVIQEDIDHGTRGSCTRCPVARALHRLGFEHPKVVVNFVEYSENDITSRAYLSERVIDRIRYYDIIGQMEPFKFDLEMPVAA